MASETLTTTAGGPPSFNDPAHQQPRGTQQLAGNKQAAHVQIHGDSGALGAAYALAGQDLKALHKLHIPLGDRRFRPSLEDFIEFLAQEKLVTNLHSGWRDVLESSRGDWIGRQVRAAVRRHPETAAGQLERMGFTVTPPDG